MFVTLTYSSLLKDKAKEGEKNLIEKQPSSAA